MLLESIKKMYPAGTQDGIVEARNIINKLLNGVNVESRAKKFLKLYEPKNPDFLEGLTVMALTFLDSEGYKEGETIHYEGDKWRIMSILTPTETEYVMSMSLRKVSETNGRLLKEELVLDILDYQEYIKETDVKFELDIEPEVGAEPEVGVEPKTLDGISFTRVTADQLEAEDNDNDDDEYIVDFKDTDI